MSFGVRAPRVVAGKVPAWVIEGLRYSVRKQPVITVGAGFGGMTAAEQDGALANAIVASDLYRIGAVKILLTYSLCFVAVGGPLVFVAAYHRTPTWVTLSVYGALYALGYLLTFALRSRRVIYRVDHRVAEVLGRPVVDLMIDHDIRHEHMIPGFVRLFLLVYGPTVAQRVRRLDTTFGAHHIAGWPARS